MKRWQDRGEVLDSDDDEDLSLGKESQLSKRVKISDDVGSNDYRHAREDGRQQVKDRSQDVEWLQPARGAVYGKQAAQSNPLQTHAFGAEPDDDDNGGTHVQRSSLPFHTIGPDKKDDTTSLATSTPLRNFERPLNAREVVAVELQAQVNPKQQLHEHASAHLSPISEQNVCQPAPPGFRFPRLGISATQGLQNEQISHEQEEHRPARAVTPVWNIALATSTTDEKAGEVSTASSSPLSERDVSPPAPASFHFPRAGPSAPKESGDDYTAGGEPEGGQTEAIPADDLAAVVAARRNLRARKEKQLHPYMLDRLQHQQQFRDRGMRPIRYDDPRQAETQKASMDDHLYESSQVSQGRSSSPLRPSSELGEPSAHTTPQNSAGTQNQKSASDDDLPDVDDLFGRTLSRGVQYGPKRRKLSHASRVMRLSRDLEISQPHASQQDELSMPSPPPTSSRSADTHAKIGPATFKFPRAGPTPLPTPHVSSDVQEHALVVDKHSPTRRSRPSTASNPRPAPTSVESSSESSEAESGAELEPADDERQLRREGRRIKGVLPASWLKLDRAQQHRTSRSPARRQMSASPSPVRAMPQKGVAQRIPVRRHSSTDRMATIAISDDESDTESRASSPSKPMMWQPKLRFDKSQENTASDFINVDEMEVDWIDPMLKGAGRPESRSSKHKKRQARITDAFNATQNRRDDFSEESRAIKNAVGATHRRPKTSKNSTRSRRPRRTSGVHLSILDRPLSAQIPGASTPQFVRLAVRRARAQVNRGRHSPTRKHIRLATRDDTEEAIHTLRAWRSGTIAPQHVEELHSRELGTLDLTEPHDDQVYDTASGQSRQPLEEIQQNRQQRLPPAIRQEGSSKQRHGRSNAVIRRSQKQQTSLSPILIADQCTSPQSRGDRAEAPLPVRGIVQAQRPSRFQPRPQRYRGAQLESLESDFDRDHRHAAFERRMHLLTNNAVHSQQRTNNGELPLSRFLNDAHANVSTQTLAHRPRKRPPKQIDAEARKYRQPSEPLPETIEVDIGTEESVASGVAVLHGLGPFGTRYATDFDVLPLALGTYFHESSFIGSGDFAASLDFAGRNLDIPTGRITIHVEDDILELGAWTEDVAVGLTRIPAAISTALQSSDDILSAVLSNIDYLLRSTIRYFTRCLAFLDRVDRRASVQSLQCFVEDLLESIAEHGDKCGPKVSARCFQYAVVLARQACHLSDHDLLPHNMLQTSQDLLSKAATRLASTLLPTGFVELRTFYEDNRHASVREAGIRDSDTAVCSLVLLHHVLQGQGTGNNSFWATIHRTLDPGQSTLNSVAALDKVWYDVFTALPALEVDVSGIARPGRRMQNTREDWSLVRRLLDRTFELYPATSFLHGSTINDYVRATLTRCYRLIGRWAWWRCESILSTVFDFFTRRNLAQLHNEDSPGSPSFLPDLIHTPSLEVQPEDRSFHIFLKMLGLGLQGMRQYYVYPDKKIGGIAWRFIPNHGRTYRKDAEVRQDDLDALRNHHDLLCTLYYASPPDHRLRVELLQNLVDHTASHREACRLNVRAWSNLTSFQISKGESVERLDPFITWFRDIMTTTISQYRLARTEVEQEAAVAKAQGHVAVGQDMIEDTIHRNQRQIAATLVDALAATKRALLAASSMSNVSYLLDGSAFWQVLDLFDPWSRRLYGVLDEALSVVKSSLDAQERFTSSSESQSGSEESQDYGDSSALQDFASTQLPNQTADRSVAEIVQAPLWHFLSSVFGADIAIDNALLNKTVDVWTQLAAATVLSGKRMWSSYINSYTPDAWDQLRDTEQKRKYTPYFLSQIVKRGNVDLEDTGVLTSWLKSLVEREATLKFQHLLTTALLNKYPYEPLLQNLPFSRVKGCCDISIDELRQRRVALISAILSNLRENFYEVMRGRPHALPGLRRTYASILSQMMQTMKNNYQELAISPASAIEESQVQGAYVDFVQQVVSFLQQYTTDICKVDRFFTESSAFPLPIGDPTYVVGRLRAYVPKLFESSKRKELAVFIHAVSERAAVDGQQGYLIDQLVATMTGAVERGNPRTPSLRYVLITAIFPAYIENAMSTPCSWVLALPIMQACGKAVEGLLYDTKYEDEESLNTVLVISKTLLECLARPVEVALSHAGLTTLPHVHKTLAAVFETAQQCLTCLQHIQRVSHTVQAGYGTMDELYGHAKNLGDHIRGSRDDFDLFEPFSKNHAVPSPWPDTRDFTQAQVSNKFRNDWYAQEGQYFLRRGRTSVEVVAGLKDEGEERSNLLDALASFRESYEMIFDGRGRTQGARRSSFGLGSIIV